MPTVTVSFSSFSIKNRLLRIQASRSLFFRKGTSLYPKCCFLSRIWQQSVSHAQASICSNRALQRSQHTIQKQYKPLFLLYLKNFSSHDPLIEKIDKFMVLSNQNIVCRFKTFQRTESQFSALLWCSLLIFQQSLCHNLEAKDSTGIKQICQQY